MTIRRRGWSAGRRSSDVDGSWRSGVRARIFHEREGGRGHLAPDCVGPSQRQGCAVMLDQRDSAHRAATGAALRAVVGRNTRGIGAALRRLVALVGPRRRVRDGCVRDDLDLRDGLSSRRFGPRRRAVPRMRRRRHRPCQRQQDDQRGRLQCRREGAEWSHAIRRFVGSSGEMGLPMGEGQWERRRACPIWLPMARRLRQIRGSARS
jgi:hypothetical protein